MDAQTISMQLLMSLLGCFGFTIVFHVKKREWLISCLGGVMTWAVYLLVQHIFQNDFGAAFIGAVAASFYGELLAPRQRECCDLYFNEDLSLSEIAEACGISRQGAWDNIRRGSEALEEIESKTELLHRQTETGERLQRLAETLQRLETMCGENSTLREQIHGAADEVRALLKTED